jgi:branched-subunit amino acid transport protein
MFELLAQYNLTGLMLGLCSFLIIGVFHPLVIKGEYYFGVKCWWAFLIAGMVAGFASVMIDNFFWQTLLAVVAFSCFWSILEVFEQRERVRKGWFPANPRRSYKKK